MAVTRSPRLGLERWSEGTDPHPNRVQWDAQQGVLDDLVAIDVQVSTWANRPMSAARGTYMWVEDEARLYRNTGTGWTTTAKIGGGGAGAQIVVAGTAAEGTSANAARADHTHNLPLATPSAHGGMSKEDKAALDQATFSATGDTLVKRSPAGQANFAVVDVSAHPQAASHATRKDYVDQVAAPSTVMRAALLALDTNLNTLQELKHVGTYVMPSYPDMAMNYPIGSPGILTVLRGLSTVTTQVYQTSGSSKVPARTYFRAAFGSPLSWSPWVQVITDVDKATASSDGLMPKADKAALDAATSSSTVNTLARRDSSGRAAFSSVQLTQTTNAVDAARKDYVDERDASTLSAAKVYTDAEAAKRVPFMGEIPDGPLNTITTPGVYSRVSTTIIGNPANNYPAGATGAGVLVVSNYSSAGIVQEWTAWAGGSTTGNRRWLRNSNDGGATWTGWRELAGTDTVDAAIAAIPEATTTVRGLMSTADKALLDGATSQATVNRLVRRNGSGDVAFRFVEGSSQPTGAHHLTRKDYVDAEVARRGSSTGQLATGPDLNTLTSPGVYNVGRETLNTPVVAGFYSSCRVEVDVIHSSLYGSNRTVFQTARANAWDTAGQTVASAFTGAHKNELMASQTFKRESHDGGSTWNDWRAEGTTPWFPMTIRTGSGTHSNNFFYGIETGSGYPGVSSVVAGSDLWRIRNGMVEMLFQFQSPISGENELDIGQVCPTLRPTIGPSWYSTWALTHQYRDILKGIATVNPDGAMRVRTTVASGYNGGSTARYDATGLTWPVPVTSYTR